MGFRQHITAYLIAGVPGGRQVIIDPASPGQISFPNPNGFSPSAVGTSTSAGNEHLTVAGPDTTTVIAGDTLAYVDLAAATGPTTAAGQLVAQRGTEIAQLITQALGFSTVARMTVTAAGQQGTLSQGSDRTLAGNSAGAGAVMIELNQTGFQRWVQIFPFNGVSNAAAFGTINLPIAFPTACDGWVAFPNGVGFTPNDALFLVNTTAAGVLTFFMTKSTTAAGYALANFSLFVIAWGH